MRRADFVHHAAIRVMGLQDPAPTVGDGIPQVLEVIEKLADAVHAREPFEETPKDWGWGIWYSGDRAFHAPSTPSPTHFTEQMEKPNPLDEIRSPTTTPQEGSTLRLALPRFEKTWLHSTFRNLVGQAWDQPALLPSAAKYPDTLEALKPALCTWDESVALDIVESSRNVRPESGIGAGVIVDHMTAVQWSALLAWRAWPLGDRSSLNLLQAVIREVSAIAICAPWASVRAAACVEDLATLSPLEKVHAWAFGRPREPAREWARELDALAAHAERWADGESWWGHGDRRDIMTACEGASIDVAASAYACALAFLLEDRDAFASNVYRMLRSAMGIACRVAKGVRFVDGEQVAAHVYQVNDRMVRAHVYQVNDRMVRNELLRAWPSVVALSDPDPTRDSSYRQRWRQMGGSQPMFTQPARLRGWVPCLHETIPPEAFEPYPNEREREDGET